MARRWPRYRDRVNPYSHSFAHVSVHLVDQQPAMIVRHMLLLCSLKYCCVCCNMSNQPIHRCGQCAFRTSDFVYGTMSDSGAHPVEVNIMCEFCHARFPQYKSYITSTVSTSNHSKSREFWCSTLDTV